MAVISTQTRKVTDLPQASRVNNSDNIMIHDGRGLKKVSVQTLKNGMKWQCIGSYVKLKRYRQT